MTVALHHEIRGTGPRVLFVNGTGADLRVKPNAFSSPLPERFTVLAYDQRGQGRSAVPPGPWTMADYAEDAVALLDTVGWDDAAVVGISFGGMVAQELAIRHPRRVTRLVLAVTSSGGAGGSSYPLHELRDVTRSTLERLLQIGDRRRDATWRKDNDAFLDQAFAIWAEQRQTQTSERARGAELQLEARRHHDAFDRLERIPCPCLVVAGEYDDLAPVANSERLVAALRDARLEVLSGGHEVLFEGPERWASVLEFLGT